MITNMATALLLEDEPLIAMDMEENLQNSGFEVVHLMSCADANQWINSNHADVAIVDIQLTDGSCREVVERLHVTGVPFVVHSGDVAHQHVGTPFEHGIWLSKPSSYDDMIAAVRKAVSMAS
jgi:DNA-binding response OmpR family regulator